MKDIPKAIADQACLIGMTKRQVYIECDTREDAEELLDWLINLSK